MARRPAWSPTLRLATARRVACLVTGFLIVLSCTRVPGSVHSKVTVRGRVLAAPGAPLPGTELSFWADDLNLRGPASVTADSSGAYLVRLISGTYRVRIQTGLGYLSRTERVTVSSTHPWIDFVLGERRVSGRVFGADGTLIDSGQVLARSQSPSPALDGHAVSKIERGRYSLFLPDGTYSLRAMNANYWSGFYPAQQESVSILADTVIDLRMPGVEISGRIIGPDGRPLKGAGVEVLEHPVRVRAGDDGRYRLYVPPGSYKVRFQSAHPFFMLPRTVGPVTITQPASLDVTFSGVEWKGRVLRSGAEEPPRDVTVAVRPAETSDGLAAALRTGAEGQFRFVLEAGRRYDLEVYDREVREKDRVLRAALARADTVLEIVLPPIAVASRADSTIALSIRHASKRPVHYVGGKKHRPPAWVEVTLRNNDPDSVTLVLPGDGSDVGWRTPLVNWDVRTSDGRHVERQKVFRCGNINPLRAGEVFTLPPGGEKTFRTTVPWYFRYETSRRYKLRLTYENRPRFSWSGMPLGRHDSAAVEAVRNSTRCKLVSNALEVEVR